MSVEFFDLSDEALMAGYRAVLKMRRFRIGDQHDHAEAFRKAAIEYCDECRGPCRDEDIND